jgi:protein-disulfide isomerase
MFKQFLAYVVAALLLVAAGAAQSDKKPSDKKSAYNKAELETYIRHLWVIPTAIGVAVGDPQPSDLPGFQEVHVKLTQGEASQEILLYVTKDGGKIVQGNVYDVNFNPFKKDLDKLQTAFQPSLGTAGATVVIVLFSDFQCPFCKSEAQMLRKNLVANYPTQVRLYFIDFPLVQLHPWAKAAAIAGRCVFHQDPASFWDYYDFVYGHQETITADNLKSTVTGWSKDRKDIDNVQLGQCMDTKDTEKEVDAEIAKATLMEVGKTPTMFVNGRRIDSSLEWPNLKAVIDNEIEYQKVAKNAGEDCGCELKLDVPGLPQTGASPIKKQ